MNMNMNTNTMGNSRINPAHERMINGRSSSSSSSSSSSLIIINNSNRISSSSSSSPSTALFNTQEGTQEEEETNAHADSSLSETAKAKKNMNDVNDLFAAYMAQRADKTFLGGYKVNNVDPSNANANTVTNTNAGIQGENENVEDAQAQPQAQNGNVNMPSETKSSSSSTWSMSGQRLFKTLYNTATNGITSATSNVMGNGNNNGSPVQHISLEPSNNDNDNDNTQSVNEVEQNAENIVESKVKEKAWMKPPNPPPLTLTPLPQSQTPPPPVPSTASTSTVESIHATYHKFQSQMMDKLNAQKLSDPNSIPDNAADILSYVIYHQKNRDLEEWRNAKNLQDLNEYEELRLHEQQQQIDPEVQKEKGMEVEVNNIVQEIVQEADMTQQREEANARALNDFQQYELSLKNDLRQRQRQQQSQSQVTPAAPVDGTGGGVGMGGEGQSQQSFDQIQLALLQELLAKRNANAENSEWSEEDIFLTDNIEDGIKELEERIAEGDIKVKGGGEPTENLKEWQMYRAIATKLAERTKSRTSTSKSFDDNIINQKMEQWKEFQQMEAEMRQKSGLTIEYRMPFAWGDQPDYIGQSDASKREENIIQGMEGRDDRSKIIANTRGPIDAQKAEEAKSELDIIAVGVLQDLITKTKDPVRQAKLSRELEELKEGMRAREEYLKNRGPILVKKKEVKPITIGQALSTRIRRVPAKKPKAEIVVEKPAAVVEEKDLFEDTYVEEDYIEDEEDYVEEVYIPPPPDSEFFRDLSETNDEEAATLSYESDDEEDIKDNDDTNADIFKSTSSEFETDYDQDDNVVSLGTLEEQKFRSLVARSGVRTVDGQNKLKSDWEEFQEAEKKMREMSGLNARMASGAEASSDSGVVGVEGAAAKVNYDPSTIFKEDGTDIDFDKIFTSIGKRPSRKGKGKGSDTSASAAPAAAAAVVEAPPDVAPEVAAHVQPEVTADVMPPPVESTTTSATTEVNASPESVVDDVVVPETQPEPVIEEKKPAPVPAAPKVPARSGLGFDFGPSYSNQNGNYEQRRADMLEYTSLSVAQIDNLMALKQSGVSPHMARRNKPFQYYGAIFNLDVLVDVSGLQYQAWRSTATTYDFEVPHLEDVQLASVHSEEYAIRKVFYWADDVFAIQKIADEFRSVRKTIFEEKKEQELANMMEEQTIRDVEVARIDETANAMDEANAAAAAETEREILQLQLTAWERAAGSYGYAPPDIASVRIVDNMDPAQAVRAVFRWTRDFVVSSDVAASYRNYLKEETKGWMTTKGDQVIPTMQQQQQQQNQQSTTTEVMSSTPSQSTMIKSAPDFEDIIEMKRRAWGEAIKTAHHNLQAPTSDDVRIAEFSGIETAIKRVFNWEISSEDMESVTADYREFLKTLTEEWMQTMNNDSSSTESGPSEEEAEEYNLPLCTIKKGVTKWLNTMEDIEIPCAITSHMDREFVDDILEHVGLSTYFHKELRVGSDTGYSSEMQQLLGGALRLERRSDQCIAFTSTPQSAGVSHEVEMKNVALVSPYPYYELTTADMIVRDFTSIGVRNLKNVFSETTIEEPMEMVQSEAPKIRRITLQKTRFWDDDDR